MSTPVESNEASPQKGAGLALRIDDQARALIASITPVPGAHTIDETWLREHLLAQGFGDLRYLPGALTILLGNYNSGTATDVRLAECVDASFTLSVSSDGLEAILDMQPAQGGNPVRKEGIYAALAEHGIGQGILDEAIDVAIASACSTQVVIARGLPPQHGEDGRLEVLIPEVRNRMPRVDETGHIDYRDLGAIQVVHPGENLMIRHPPTEGVPGRTLFGEILPATPGKEVMYAPQLQGTAFAPNNPNLLQAALTGQPVVIPGGMMVEPVYRVENVTTGSGNIDFDGSVVINGDVSAGMTVRATGDIEVGGVVEVATLEAGGSIVVKGGVMGGVGRKTTDEHFIHCGGSFSAAYAQQAKVSAEDSIFIDDLAMQCELTAINHIFVGNKRRGHIIGGHLQATLSITANVIGSPNRVRTHCEIGVNPLMHKQLLEICKRRDGRETQLMEVSKLLDFGCKNPGKLRPEMLQKAKTTASTLATEIAAIREEQEILTRKIELTQRSRVNAKQLLHEGVEVHLSGKRYAVARETGPASVGIGGAGLELLPLEAMDAASP